MKLLIILVSLFFVLSSIAQEHADAFIVEIQNDKVRVISPKKRDGNIPVIILNKTITKFYGKLATEKKDLQFLSLEPRDQKSLHVSGKDFKNLSFIPLSPPLQEVNLVFGKKAYEVPKQK